MISICLVYKEWPEKWWWLIMSDQIFLILVFVWYTKTELVYWLVNGFFVIPLQCSIPEATKTDYFWLVYVLYTAKQYMYSNLFYLLWITYNSSLNVSTRFTSCLEIKSEMSRIFDMRRKSMVRVDMTGHFFVGHPHIWQE